MKTALIATTMLLTLGTAMAGQPTLITCTAPQPAPKASCPVTFEVANFYGWANNNLFKGGFGDKIDIYGGDVTMVRYMDMNNSVNLRFGYGFGDEGREIFGTKFETDVHNFYLMPGYRYTSAINEDFSMYLGLNAGVANLSIKDHARGPWGKASAHNSAYGFAYSAEIGLRYCISKNFELFAAYEFRGSTASPDFGYGPDSISARNQTYHVVRAGVSFAF